MALEIHEGLLLSFPREQVFEFFASAENLSLLTPPWLRFSILTPLTIEMTAGTVIGYRIRLHGLPITWESEITEWRPPFEFCDVQRCGPYRRWVHRHIFEEVPGGTLVVDHVDYLVPQGALVNRLFVARELSKVFAHRKAKVLELYP